MTHSSDIIDQLHAAVTEVDARMTEEERFGTSIARRTNQIIRAVLVLLVIVALVVLYLIQDLALGMLLMTDNMVSMYEHFSDVSQDMQAMTRSVVQMNDQIASLPAMRENMGVMRQDMGNMSRSVQSMDDNLAAMDLHVANITGGVSEMAWRFEWLTNSTRGVGNNVNQMTQPMRAMDPFGFLGR